MFFRKLGATRIAVVALAAGMVGLGLDAGIAHFAGREMKHALQLVPVFASPIIFVGLAAAALLMEQKKRFRLAARIGAAATAMIGVIGTVMHGRTFFALLEGTPWALENIEAALRIAPPLAAPAGFIALGGLLALLASPRLSLSFGAAPAPSRPAPVAA